MTTTADSIERAQELGIAPFFFTFTGEQQAVPPEVLDYFSEILSLPPPEADEFSDVFIIPAEQNYELALLHNSKTFQLIDEKEQIITLTANNNTIYLPALPIGYYQLHTDSKRFFLISAPKQCYENPALIQGKKLTGLNLQLYSLRSEHNWGIGDFGDIQRSAQALAKKGIDFIGLNPLHALFPTHPEWASPYSPTSKSRLNSIYLDVSAVQEFQRSTSAQKWFNSAEVQHKLKQLRQTEFVDYTGVFSLKQQALKFAFHYFAHNQASDTLARRKRFIEFVHQGGEALYKHALFEALEQHFHPHLQTHQQAPQDENQMGWFVWESAYQDVNSPAIQTFATQHQMEIEYFLWLQWLCEEQLALAQSACQMAGMQIGLYGDLAVGVARAGSDTWAQPEAFCLNASIGAPPDPLGPQGQNWQLPPLHPQKLRRQGYRIFIEMLRANMRHYGMLRIDHVMAFERLWWIMKDHQADAGAYVHYALPELMAILAVESQRAQCVVIGEDLGIVSDAMRDALRQYHIYSFAVLYFMKSGARYLPPANWAAKAIAVMSTHDLAPLAAYWQEKDITLLKDLSILNNEAHYQALKQERAYDKLALSQQLGFDSLQEYSAELVSALHQYVANSQSQLFAIQLENLLPFTSAFNVPGVSQEYPNWRVKLPLTLETIITDSAFCTNLAQMTCARQALLLLPSTSESTMNTPESQIIEALCQARLTDPFAYLGIHEQEKGVIIRCYYPDADTVEVCIGNKRYPMQQVDKRGVFACYLLDYAPFTHYQLCVHYGEQALIMEDPYRFAPDVGELDNWLLAEGRHLRPYEKLGAHLCSMDGVSGTRFSVWAPNAKRVSVIGDFNHWDGRRHPMRLHFGSGIWELFLPQVSKGALYKFEILDANDHVLTKADPYAFEAELRPATASKVSGLPEKVTPNPEQQKRLQNHQPISIYEVHLGSWRRNTSNNYWLDYKQIADELIPYVKSMGFTHIELMPIAEFPFDGSWGYQATGFYAPTSRFGNPEGLRELIARAHEAGIGVLLDWVVGHFPHDAHGLAHFDGSALYEHADPREGYHQDWNTLIFNYGRHEVRNYLSGNALYWIERFGVDGLRVDAVASMIYRDYSRAEGQWIPNQYGGRENLEAIDFLRATNHMLRQETGASAIAEESTSFTGVTHKDNGGLAFDYKWNMGWMNDTLRYMQHDPVHRKYHHNLMTFGMMYQYSEQFMLPLSHDEVVHGKGSLLDKMPGDCWQKFANLRAYYGYMWGYPGKKLLFMGNEFAQGREWNYQESLDWYLLDEGHGDWHRGVQNWVRDLNHFYQQHPALFEQDYQPQGFEWRVVDDAEQSVLAFERISSAGERVLIVSNFTPVPRHDYRIGVPIAGYYREALNSDAACYQGSDCGNQGGVHTEAISAHHQEHSLCLTIPPLATLFLVLENS